MSLLKEATNQMAYAKVGILGFAGSGKTYTASNIAIGLHKYIGSNKPIAFLDTETGSDFMVKRFADAGIKLLVAKSKTFPDLMEFMQEAQETADIAIIDSITHIWAEIQTSFLAKINKDRQSRNLKKLFRLEFQHWNQIKPEWGKFTEKFLVSPMHVLLCGRAGYEYDYEQHDADSKKELVKTGTKMKAEGEMAYEPSLLIEMEREQFNPEYQKQTKNRAVINRAFVLKDRSDLLDGKYFDSPGFETFLPHFQYLNIGGVHHVRDEGTSSESLFDDQGRGDFDRMKHEKTKTLEEIQGLMTSEWPGQSAAEKKSKSDILQDVFNTRSWTALEDMSITTLKEGFFTMQDKIREIKTGGNKLE